MADLNPIPQIPLRDDATQDAIWKRFLQGLKQLLKQVGTVTSVGLSLPSSVFDVTGSPVTTSGTLTATFDTQSANRAFMGPTTGAAATPTFRALVAADLPAGTGTVTSVDVSGGTTGLTTSGGPITTSGTITLTGTLDADNGGTGLASYAVGDILYAATTTTLAKLADVATGNAVISGGVGVAPSWGKIGLTTHVSGTLPVGNGGTNSATALSGSSIMISNGSAVVQGAAGTTTTVLHGNASGAPTYGAVTLTTDVTGTLPVANGGTSLATLTAHALYVGNGTSAPTALAVGASNTFLKGSTGADPAFGTATLASADFANQGTTTTVLHGNAAGNPSFGAVSLTADVSGVLPETKGGTNQSTYTTGDIIYSSASNTLSKLAGNITTTKKFLRQTGSGAASAAPAWDTVTAADVPGSALTRVDDTNVTLTLGGSPTTALLNAASITAGWTGTLGVARGGTNIGSYAIGDIIYASGATTLSKLADVATGNALISGGVTTAPSWGKIGLTTHVSGTLGVGNGGTGVTSLGALTKTDDTNVTLTLGGSPTTALVNAASLTLGWTGTLGVARGGTNIASYAIGDIIYASGATTLSKLADVATGNALISGGVTTAPSWGKIGLTTHVSGTLPVANGGTGDQSGGRYFSAVHG